jgi:hypothetical protein
VSPELKPLEGAFRARLEEPEWASVWSAATPEGLASPVAPLPLEPGVKVPGNDVPVATREAVTVATGATAAVTLELASITPSRGILASLGTDGSVAAGIVRALVVPDPGAARSADDVKVAPGVEVSAYPVGQLVEEILRLLPPDPATVVGADETDSIRVSADWAMILARAVQEHDEAMLRQIATECGWDEVPDVLVSLAENVRANATVLMRVSGSDRIGVRRWLLCHLGWVSVDLADGFVTHRLRTREQIRDDLVADLAGALDAVLAAAGPHAG